MMAKNGTECDVYRDSSVYVSAEIQGYLERKKGVLGGKTKQWCSLQGLTLYLQKKQSDVVETIDLKDVSQVRKVTNENTGTHFEICMKKKSHVFICSSNEDCMAWVQALQTAILRNNASQQNSSVFSDAPIDTDDKNVYNEIDESLIRKSCVFNMNLSETQPDIPADLSNYTEPCDIENSVRKSESGYWEVADLRNCLHKSQSTLGSAHDNSTFSTSYATIDQVCADGSSKGAEEPLCTYGYSQVNKAQMSTLLQRPENVTAQNVPELGTAQVRGIARDKNVTSNITINIVVENESTSNEGKKFAISENQQMMRPETEDDGSMCQILLDALTDSGCPSYDYIHPLTEDDRKPVKELTEFLSKNNEICRASYSCMSMNSDPVSTLKSYLANLDISPRQLSND